MADTYDVIVIGAGPGGYVSAIRAAQLGLRTAVVDREHLGGICLNWGCIPTKALLRSAEIYHYMQHPSDYGLTLEGKVGVDMAGVVKRSRGVAKRLADGVAFLMKKNKIDVIWGEATIAAAPKGGQPGQVAVAETKRGPAPQGRAGSRLLSGQVHHRGDRRTSAGAARYRARQEAHLDLLRSDGSAGDAENAPRHGFGRHRDRVRVLLPHHGAEVTVVEVLPQILPVEDAEIAAFARKRFEKQGIKFLTGTKVTKVEKAADTVTATLEDAQGKTQQITADRLISAVGVVGNVENLGLEALGVKIERGIVATDGLGRTNVPGIYAIGDVAGPPMLAHKAEHEGERCVEAIKGLHAEPLDRGKIRAARIASPRSPRSASPKRRRRRAGSTSASAASRSRATARPSPSARTRGWSRPSSTARAANSSAPTWSGRRSPNSSRASSSP